MYSILNNKCVRIDFTDTECTSIEELKKYKWIIPWSGGKDSTATVYLCHQYGIPVEKIVYVRMMWDDKQPATLPIMTEFVDEQAEKFRKLGYKVEIVPSVYTAMSLILHIPKKSKKVDRNGKFSGITPFARRFCCLVNAKSKTINNLMNKDYHELIGYTVDEVNRHHRCSKKKSSVLKILRLSQKDSLRICKENDGLSPLYDLGISRDGCWFCPNAAKKEREHLRKNYPELVKRIYWMIELCDFDLSSMEGINNWLDDYIKEKTERGRMVKLDFSKCRILEIDFKEG